MSIKLNPDQVCVNGQHIATDLGDALVVQDDEGSLWVLTAVTGIEVLTDSIDGGTE